MSEVIHLHKNRLNRNLQIFLLFIPAIVFVMVVAVLFSIYG